MKAIAIIAGVIDGIIILAAVFALILIAAFAMVAMDIDFKNTDFTTITNFDVWNKKNFTPLLRKCATRKITISPPNVQRIGTRRRVGSRNPANWRNASMLKSNAPTTNRPTRNCFDNAVSN